MVHPLGDYACQPSDSSVIAHSLTAFYYINGAAYTHGQTQTIANSCAKVSVFLASTSSSCMGCLAKLLFHLKINNEHPNNLNFKACSFNPRLCMNMVANAL